MTNPVVVDDVFGPLDWDPLVECWRGHVTIADGRCIGVSINITSEEDRSITQEARDALSRVLAQQSAFTKKAADDLLGIHNEGWHHYESTPALSAAQFEERLTLESVHLESWGAATASYDDGDLFWGHQIIVHQEEDGTFAYEAFFEG